MHEKYEIKHSQILQNPQKNILLTNTVENSRGRRDEQ